jgi:hypothetical protein
MELVRRPRAQAMCRQLASYPTCMTTSACYQYVGIVNWHDYDATYTPPDTVNATPYPSGWATGKKYWMTEVSGPNGDYGLPPGCTAQEWCPTVDDAMVYAAWIDDRLAVEGANAYFEWCPNGTSCLTLFFGQPHDSETRLCVRTIFRFRASWNVPHRCYSHPADRCERLSLQNTSSGAFAIVATNYTSSAVAQQFSNSRLVVQQCRASLPTAPLQPLILLSSLPLRFPVAYSSTRCQLKAFAHSLALAPVVARASHW